MREERFDLPATRVARAGHWKMRGVPMARRWISLALALPLLLALACDSVRKVEEHVLNRIGYGPDAWSRARIRTLGPSEYIKEQLRPHLLDDAALEADLAARYPTLVRPYADLRRIYHEYGAANGGPTRVRQEMSYAKLLRAALSKRQLEQVLVDFWYNHFNVFVRRDLARWAALPYERDAIRPYVLGRFEDMLKATAGNVAMINYLDNQVNFKDGFERGARTYGINENYARELLELHTVGPDAGYTLGDIQEVARAFTGWTTHTLTELPVASNGFLYIDEGHDKGAKTIMGELFIPAGGGLDDGDAVLEYLAQHPLTAERVARKLCVRFVSETPSETLVQQAKNTYLSTQGDLFQVMRKILESNDFVKAGDFRRKVKRPIAFVASAGRAVGVADLDVWSVNAFKEIEKMGEPAYEAVPPIGYPEASGAWVSEGPFLRRVNYVYSATGPGLGFAPLPVFTGTSAEVVDQLTPYLLQESVGNDTLNALIGIVNGHNASSEVRQAAAALLVSPEFLSQ
jgi:hypothetical protein